MIVQDRVIALTFPVFIFSVFWTGLPESDVMAMPPVQRKVLENGLVLLVSPEHSLPIVTMQLLMNAGSWRDPSGQEGLANLTAKGLLLGTSKPSSESAESSSAAGSASVSPSPGRCSRMPPSSSSTKPPRTSTPSPKCWCKRRWPT